MERIEIELGQGWSRGLKVAFENAKSSAALDRAFVLQVKQSHGKEIIEVGPEHLRQTGELGEADGLFMRGDFARECPRPLAVKSADCLPLLYVDHKSECVAAVHAGWRGLVKGIHRVPFERGWFDPNTTWVWVGPSLNGMSFEVGEDMWSQFPAVNRDEKIFRPAGRDAHDSSKRFFFAWDFVENEMNGLGVELVYNVNVDTLTDASFNSYRRQRQSPAPSNFSWIGFNSPGFKG